MIALSLFNQRMIFSCHWQNNVFVYEKYAN